MDRPTIIAETSDHSCSHLLSNSLEKCTGEVPCKVGPECCLKCANGNFAHGRATEKTIFNFPALHGPQPSCHHI